MKTIGELLRQSRIKKALTVEQIAQNTKIRPDYITAIEDNRFDKLPSATFVKGFIQNYAKAVSLKPSTALAVFRRDFDQNQKGETIPRGLTNPIKTPSKLYNPKTTTIAIVSITTLALAGYLFTQILSFTQAPPIKLNSPRENQQTNSIVKVSGKTSSDATIIINQKPISLSLDGEFETTLDLVPGEHTITIQAQSRDGKTRTIQRTITVQSD